MATAWASDDTARRLVDHEDMCLGAVDLYQLQRLDGNQVARWYGGASTFAQAMRAPGST
jgi:hypothetical protein